MPVLLAPARLLSQPHEATPLAPEFWEDSALAFNFSKRGAGLNLAQRNLNRQLAVDSPLWYGGLTGLGIGSSASRALLDTAWPEPLVTSDGVGTGAYVVAFQIQPFASATRSTPFHIRTNTGAFNSVIVSVNGYFADGASSSTANSGTLWVGDFQGSPGFAARGLRVDGVVDGRLLNCVFSRDASGNVELWINGALAASGTQSVNDILAGATQYLSVGGFASSATTPCPYPIFGVYAANRAFSSAEARRISENFWALFEKPRTALFFTAGAGGQTLTPPLLTNTSTLYEPTVTPGPVTLAPPLLTNTNTLYEPVVAPGAVTLQPPLLDNANTLYAPAVTPGPVDLAPPLLANTNVLYEPTVAPGPVSLSPPLLTNTSELYAPSVAASGALQLPLLENVSTLYAPTVTPGPVDLALPLLTNTSALYAPTVSQGGTRYARPDADVSAGAWQPSSGSDLFAMLDEESANDLDYIHTSVASTCAISLGSVPDPASSSGQVVRYRARSSSGSTLTARLKQGAATIATRTHTGVPASWTTYSMVLTSGEADSITDYSNLTVELEAA